MIGRAGVLATKLLVALAWSASAQSTVGVTVDTTHVTVGDRVTMTVTVDHPPGTTVAWPDSLDIAPFEVLAVRPLPEGSVDGQVRSGVEVTVTAFELGTLEIPSIDVSVVAADGTEETLSTNPYGIEVASVGVDEGGDIRDIRGPLGIPLSPLRLVLWILASLLVVALLFVLARRLRPGKPDARPALGALPRPAHEVALDALAALEASGLLARGEVKEFHIQASDILRTYVEERFRVEAREMTTHEVLEGLAARDIDPRFRDGLRAFLEQCDLVKFAKVRPGNDASLEVLEVGRRIVIDSAPKPEPAAPANEREVAVGATEAA